MTASVGFMIVGVSRSSKRTSRGPYRTVPSMIYLSCSVDLAQFRGFRIDIGMTILVNNWTFLQNLAVWTWFYERERLV